jgi:hypothetical protein
MLGFMMWVTVFASLAAIGLLGWAVGLAINYLFYRPRR